MATFGEYFKQTISPMLIYPIPHPDFIVFFDFSKFSITQKLPYARAYAWVRIHAWPITMQTGYSLRLVTHLLVHVCI